MPKTIDIFADDRERGSEVLDALRQRENVRLTVGRLESGDYLVGGSVLFERKAASDFARSIIDNRLFSQAARLVRSRWRPAYVIEGDARAWLSLGIRRQAIQGALISLMLVFDIPVLRAVDATETAALLGYAGGQLARAAGHGITPIRKLGAKRQSSRQQRILQSLPGVGRERALRLLEHFGSVQACLQADASELEQVEGVGPRIARLIVKSVSEDPGRYGATDSCFVI